MGVIADLIIKLGVDDSGVGRTMEGAGRHASKFGSTLLTVGKYAAVAGGAAGIAGLAYTLKTGYSEWTDSTKVAAQTGAVIKSTGGAANVTAGHVDRLANSILEKSGIDDEAVKSGENMLLTFTGIRNEVGKGNDVFDQATKAVADMDTAMTHGNSTAESMSKTSILVGKALQDPVKGATALRRVGVALSESQQKQIAAFVKSGNTMAAQKLILHELNKEFGGSAEAMGKTLPGQIKILRENFNNMAGDLFTKLVPALTKVLTWVDTNWPTISAVFGAVFHGIGLAITNVIAPALAFIIAEGKKVVAWFQAHWDEIRAIAVRVFNALAPPIIGTLNTIKSVVQGDLAIIEAFWSRFGDTIKTVLRNDWNAISGIVRGAMEVIRGIVNVIGGLLHGDWSRVWTGIKQIFGGTWQAIEATLRGALGNMKAELQAGLSLLGAAARAIGQAILNGIVGALKGVASLVQNGLEAVHHGIRVVAGEALGWAAEIGERIVAGVVSGLGSLASRVAGAVKGGIESGIHAAGSILHGSGEFMFTKHAVGEKMGQGIAEGIRASEMLVVNALSGLLTRAIAAKNFGNVSQIIQSMFSAQQAAVQTPAERQVAAIQRSQNVDDLKQSIADAKKAVQDSATALAAAQAAGDAQAVADAQAQLAADQRAEKRAEQDLKLFNLQEKAAKQRAALDAKQTAQQIKLGMALDRLNTLFEKHGETIGQLTAAVHRILHGLHVPGFAGGVRNYGGGLAVVGENGPELLNLPGGSDVYTNAEMRGMLRPGSFSTDGGDGDVVLMLDSDVLARFSRRSLTRKGMRNVGLKGLTA